MRFVRISCVILLLGSLAVQPMLFAQKKGAKPAPAAPAAPATPPVTEPTPTAPATPEKYTSVEGITEYRLPNGLRILLFPDPSKPTITVNITYLVGSRHENYGETGMAHLLEHLVFKGTPKHPNIPEELTKHGARPNGTTWLDRTNYFETFSATDENLEWALDLESDRMVNSFIAKKDLESEMTVVRNEFEMGENSPNSILEERILSTAYLWHNYGKSTIGCRADLENVPIDRLQAFYRNYYQPDNAILLIAGKFDEKKALGLITKYFAPIPRPNRTIQKTYTLDPTQDGERSVTLRRTGDIQIAAAAYKICAGTHPDFPALEMLISILAEDGTGRLYKALVDTKKASSVTGYGFPTKEPGYMYFATEVRVQQSLDSARQIFLATLDSAAKQPVSKEDVERARTALLKIINLTLNSADRVGLQLSEYMAHIFPSPRPFGKNHSGRRAASSSALFEAIEPHNRHVYPNRQARPHRNPRRTRRRGDGKRLQRQRSNRCWRSIRPVSCKYRSPHQTGAAWWRFGAAFYGIFEQKNSRWQCCSPHHASLW